MLAGEKIRQYRKNIGMDTTELASRIGVNQATISRYENGYVRKIPDDTLKKLAEALDCTVNDLIEDDPSYAHLHSSKKRKAALKKNMSQDDQLILSWFHSLSPEVRAFFKNCAEQNLKNTAEL